MPGKRSHFEPAYLYGGEIDTHFHASKLSDRGLETEEVLTAAFGSGLRACIDVGLAEDDIEARHKLLDEHSGVYFAHGLYPSNAARDDLRDAMDRLRSSYDRHHVCALGEIGIDRRRDYGTSEQQKRLFAEQIELANELRLPVIVHNRDAERDILDVLASHAPQRESVMHCYSGPAEMVSRFLDFGFSISFGGNVTFKNAPALREALDLVPIDRLLLETDAPFLAPHPRRGRPNYPGLIGYTYKAVAEHRQLSPFELIASVVSNAKRVFELELDPL